LLSAMVNMRDFHPVNFSIYRSREFLKFSGSFNPYGLKTSNPIGTISNLLWSLKAGKLRIFQTSKTLPVFEQNE